MKSLEKMEGESKDLGNYNAALSNLFLRVIVPIFTMPDEFGFPKGETPNHVLIYFSKLFQSVANNVSDLQKKEPQTAFLNKTLDAVINGENVKRVIKILKDN